MAIAEDVSPITVLLQDSEYDEQRGVHILKDPKRLTVTRFMHLEPDRLSTVGICKITDQPDQQMIWKVGDFWDYNSVGEYRILSQLNETLEWCPHFPKAYGIAEVPVHPRIQEQPRASLPFIMDLEKCSGPKRYKKKKRNILPNEASVSAGGSGSGSGDQQSERNVKWCKNEFIFQELIQGSKSAYDFSEECENNSEMYSIMQQVNMALLFSYDYCQFTHYDMHSGNVLIDKTDVQHRLYILSNDFQIFISTQGLRPVIIDTGYSYSSTLERKPLDVCVQNFHIGYTPHTSDPHYDLRMWLFNVVEDWPSHTKTLSVKRRTMYRKFRDIYRRHHMDPDNAWFSSGRSTKSLNTRLEKVLSKHAPMKSVGRRYCMELLSVMTHLINLPLREPEESEKIDYTDALCEAWHKITHNIFTLEKKLGGFNLRRYYWKCMMEFARVSLDHTSFEEKNREWLLQYDVKPTTTNWEILYKNIWKFVKIYEILLSANYEPIGEIRAKELSKTYPPTKIVRLMEHAYHHTHPIRPGDKIMVHSLPSQLSMELVLSDEQLQTLNAMKASERATVMYEIYKQSV